MKINNIKIKGAYPFREERSFSFKDGLTAVAGDNGSGKTTLLEAITIALFGETPNRKGLSLYDSFVEKDSMVQVDFEIQDKQYIVKRVINPNSRTQKVFFASDGKAITEGKVTQFNEFLDNLGFDKNIFYSGIFVSQNSFNNLVNVDEHQRRKTFETFLNLDNYETLFEKNREILKEKNISLEVLKRKISNLENELSKYSLDSLKSDIKTTENQIKDLKNQQLEKEQELDKQQKERYKFENSNLDISQLEDKNQKLQAQIQEITNLLSNLEEKKRNNKTHLLDRKDIIIQAKKETDRIFNEILEIESKIKNQENLIENEKVENQKEKDILLVDLSKIQETTLKIENQITEERKIIENQEVEIKQEIQNLRQKKESIDLENQKIQQEKSQIELKISTIEKEIEIKQKQASTLDNVPCKSQEELVKSCPLLEQAKKSKFSCEGLDLQKTTLESELKSLQILDNLEIVKQIKESEIKLENISKENLNTLLEYLEVTKKDFQVQNNKILNHKSSKLLELETELKNLKNSLEFEKENVKKYQKDFSLFDKLELAQERIDTYQAEISKLTKEKINHSQELEKNQILIEKDKSYEKEKSSLLEKENEIKQVIERKKVNISELEKHKNRKEFEIQNLEKLTKEKEDFEKNQLQTEKEIYYYNIIRTSLSPQGARALLVEMELAKLSEQINSLIEKVFENRFTVQLSSIKKTASGKEKESIEINIIDNETGIEAPVESKSGGEQELIKECISLSLALYSKDKDVFNSQLLVRDETTSALTIDNASKYMDILERVKEIGNFEQILFVSHNPSCVDRANQVVKL